LGLSSNVETCMHAPKEKRKIEINIYRERCRNFVASHPKLHPNHKVIIMRMADYINRHTLDVFVGETTLAADCNTTPRSVERAKKSARALGIIERTFRGNTGRPSRHIFKVQLPDTSDVPGLSRDITTRHFEPNYPTLVTQLPDTRVARTSEITSEIITSEILDAPSSSRGLEGRSSVAPSDNQIKEVGEGEVISIAVSDNPASESPNPEKFVPRDTRPSEAARKQQVAAAMVQLTASGLDMSLSRRRRQGERVMPVPLAASAAGADSEPDSPFNIFDLVAAELTHLGAAA
jgi:hypothetical protein